MIFWKAFQNNKRVTVNGYKWGSFASHQKQMASIEGIEDITFYQSNARYRLDCGVGLLFPMTRMDGHQIMCIYVYVYVVISVPNYDTSWMFLLIL